MFLNKHKVLCPNCQCLKYYVNLLQNKEFRSPLPTGFQCLCDIKDAFRSFTGLYFSAHWCSPCRGFTPKLVEFYNTMKANNQPMEIIYVSLDRDRSSFDEYYGTMPWYTIPFDDNEARVSVGTYVINSIPFVFFKITKSFEKNMVLQALHLNKL